MTSNPSKTVSNISSDNGFNGFNKINPVDASTTLLNITWALFLIVAAGLLCYFVWQLIIQMKEKRISDAEMFHTFKVYDDIIKRMTMDIDNLGKKVRNLEQRK